MSAFLNIGLNAAHAMPNGGVLSFTTCHVNLDDSACIESEYSIAPGPYIQIQVDDTGIGMSHKVLSHLFEPFFTTKGPEQGTGLGLHVTRETIIKHHGAITVTSKERRGTTFFILLPIIE